MSQGSVYWQEPAGTTVTGSEIIGPVRQNNQDVSLTIDQITGKELARALTAEGSLMVAIAAETTRAQAAEAILGQAATGNEKTANKGQANGYPGLDAQGNLIVNGIVEGNNTFGNRAGFGSYTMAANVPATNADGSPNTTAEAVMAWNIQGVVANYLTLRRDRKMSMGGWGCPPDVFVWDENGNSTQAGQGKFGSVSVSSNIFSSTSYFAFLAASGGQPAFEARDPGAPTANYPFVLSSVAGSPVQIGADGSDANIGVKIAGKGTGIVMIGSDLQIINCRTTPGPAGSGIIYSNGNSLAIS
jgi:hypothetical protein